MNELERASRASRSVSRSSQYSRRQRRQQQHELSDQQQQHQQPTTGDESSWETDRERGSSNELLRGPADSRTHGSQSNLSRQQGRGRRSGHGSLRSAATLADAENWTDHDMDIYTAHNTMRHGLVHL